MKKMFVPAGSATPVEVEDAVQERETETVDVEEQAGDGEAVGAGDEEGSRRAGS